MGQCLTTFQGHTDDVLDICFNATGNKLVTASADSTAKVYSVSDATCLLTLEGKYLNYLGHEKDISKVTFNPQGTKILTAGFDQVARLWDSESGELLQ